MTAEAAARIQSATAKSKSNGGTVQKGSFSSRASSAAAKIQEKQIKIKSSKNFFCYSYKKS